MKRRALAVALPIGLATPSQADYLGGRAAYSRADYATALQEFKPLAEWGDAGGASFGQQPGAGGRQTSSPITAPRAPASSPIA